jgi:hypothetical protein
MIDAKGTTARYVRLYSNGSTLGQVQRIHRGGGLRPSGQMTRGFRLWMLLAVLLALGLRSVQLESRPMHNDEANQFPQIRAICGKARDTATTRPNSTAPPSPTPPWSGKN